MPPPSPDPLTAMGDDAPTQGVFRSQSGRVIVVAIVIAVAASAAALLVH